MSDNIQQIDRAAESVQDAAQAAADSAKEAVDRVADRAVRVVQRIQKRPVQALAVAFVSGIVMGLFLRR